MSEFDTPINDTPQPVAHLVVPRLHFGQRLLTLRIDHNLDLNQASLLSNIPADTINRLESGDLEKINLHPHYCKCLIERLCLQAYDAPATEILEAYELDLRAYQMAHGLEEDTDARTPWGNEEKKSSRYRASALFIGFVIFLILGTVVVGWLNKRYQQQQVANDSVNHNLTELLQPPRLPLEALPIP